MQVTFCIEYRWCRYSLATCGLPFIVGVFFFFFFPSHHTVSGVQLGGYLLILTVTARGWLADGQGACVVNHFS